MGRAIERAIAGLRACCRRFVADERGSESVELAVVTLAMACAVVASQRPIRDAIDERASAVAEALRLAGR